ARALRAELEPRIGRVLVQVRGAREDDRISVDGRTLAPSELTQPIPVDPGTRVVTVSRDGAVIDRVEIAAPEGGVTHVVLSAPATTTLERTSDAVPLALAVDPGASSTPADDLTWLWVLVGVGGAAVIAGVIAGAVVGSQAPGPSREGDFMPGVIPIELGGGGAP
ncbi:MAG: hypothetical protein M3Y87_30915, partial [Myxococcota bacterium]|nr:hypothetical protein [Myxococcota bacterium]